jgi:hypothetical protein
MVFGLNGRMPTKQETTKKKQNRRTVAIRVEGAQGCTVF